MRDYSGLTREQLEARLDAAEDVVVMWAWCPSRSTETERDAAAHELWLRWQVLPGADASPAGNRHLSDELVRELAARRAATRAATLERLVGGEA